MAGGGQKGAGPPAPTGEAPPQKPGGSPPPPRHSLMLKYRARRDHKPSFARAAHQLNGDDAVAPKCKEVVVDPNTLDTQNLRKQPAQQLLLRRARHTPKPSTKLPPTHRRTMKPPATPQLQ